MDEKEAEAPPIMGTIFLVVIPWFWGIIVPIHQGEAWGRGQLSFGNPDD